MEFINNAKSAQVDDKRPFYMGFLFFAGVLLPAVALGVELTTRLCAEHIFDPVPSWWHAFFIFFVVATNLQTWWAIRQKRAERIVWLGLANAVAVFISLFYTVLFVPILPAAVVGLMVLIGILPMAPLFSLIAALLMRRDLRRMAPDARPFALRWQGLVSGFLIVFLAIGAAEMTFALTKLGIEKADSDSIEKQTEGLNFIRRFGDEDYLLRLCYHGSGVATTDFFFNVLLKSDSSPKEEKSRVSMTEKARKTFYRLNGTDYRSVPPPRGIKYRGSFINERTENAEFGAITPGLSLAGSQMDGSIDGDAALGYMEWTLTLRNDNFGPAEASAHIQLPPGSVVSRLTLWINGEEREAAFARRGQVTEAYNAVVSKRKDPVLVTTSGKDRISMKAFPVPEKGEMKIRIGITAPLELENETIGRLAMPYFKERNFAVAAEHSIWFESKKPLESAGQNFVQEQPAGIFAVRGKVKDAELSRIGSPLRAVKSVDAARSWSLDKNDPPKIIRQEIIESNKPALRRIIFVVDTSGRMKEFQNEIAGAIRNISGGAETALVLTGGNGFNRETAAPNAFVGSAGDIASKIENAEFGGGTDAVEALAKAWELAQERPESAIVWVHSAQPVELAAPGDLQQMWTRRAGSPVLYSLQSRLGRDVIEKKLSESNIVETVPRFGALSDDLSRHLKRLGGQNRKFEFVRAAAETKGLMPPAGARETSSHLVRLWANDEVGRLLADKSPGNEKAALDLAVKYQLVTPVSGAVVLETKEQYDQFDLRPVEANTVPTIPEPEEYLLFGVVLSLMIWMFRRFKRENRQTI